jgi:hypothetical protein
LPNLFFLKFSTRFQQTVGSEKEQQWQQPPTSRRGRLTPDLIALDFSIEFVRAQLSVEENPVEAELEKIREILRLD